jgi:glycosyltransferase involved in cell wall biosynthesis
MKIVKKNPDISIVMATYNEIKRLPACLRSIKNQDFEGQVELVAIDSHSTDGTWEALLDFGARAFRAPKEGPGLAKRRGCKKVQAEVVVIFDADSVIPKRWLGRAYRNLKKPGVTGTGGPYVYANLPKVLWPINNLFYCLILSFLKTLPGGSIAFRKKDYLKVGGFPKGVTFAEDTYLSHKLSKLGKLLIDPGLAVIESGRRFGIRGLLSGNLSYTKQAIKYLITDNIEDLKKIRMKRVD